MKKDIFADDRKKYHIIHRKTSEGHRVVIIEKLGTKNSPSDIMLKSTRNRGVLRRK